MSNVNLSRTKCSVPSKPPIMKIIEKHNVFSRSPSTSRIASNSNSRSPGKNSPEKLMNNQSVNLPPRKTGSCQNLSHNQTYKTSENFHHLNYEKYNPRIPTVSKAVSRSNTNNIENHSRHSKTPINIHENKLPITSNVRNGKDRTATNNSYAIHSNVTSTNGSFYNGYNETKPFKSKDSCLYQEKSSSGSSSTNSPEASGYTVSRSLSTSGGGYNTTTTSSVPNNTTTHSSFTHSSSSDNCNRYNSDSHSNGNGNRNQIPRSETTKSLNNSFTGPLGLVGLDNFGNKCFMNSVLQCLSNCKPLHEYCLSNKYDVDLNTNSKSRGLLIKSYAELMKLIWRPGTSSHISPDKFRRQFEIIAPTFHGTDHQDSQEFLRIMLEALHQDVNKIRQRSKPSTIKDEDFEKLNDLELAEEYWNRYVRIDDSFIVDLFVGQLKSTLQCTKCNYKSTTFDPFWDLSLPIPKNGRSPISLTDCLNLFTSEEVLDGDEMPKCSKCKIKRPCTKRFSIYKFPEVLVIHLKRFYGYKYRSKNSALIEFPTKNLNFQGYSANNSSVQSVTSYNLFAVSNHSGTVDRGHYTAYCCNPYSKSWHLYDDTRVIKVNEKSVCSSEAYVLFYEMVR